MAQVDQVSKYERLKSGHTVVNNKNPMEFHWIFLFIGRTDIGSKYIIDPFLRISHSLGRRWFVLDSSDNLSGNIKGFITFYFFTSNEVNDYLSRKLFSLGCLCNTFFISTRSDIFIISTLIINSILDRCIFFSEIFNIGIFLKISIGINNNKVNYIDNYQNDSNEYATIARLHENFQL